MKYLVNLLSRTFASLRYRDYRLLWVGAVLSNIGTWIQTAALAWLVLLMTNSALYLGLVNFASTIPVFFLSFTAGIYADRLNKKRLIIVTQAIALVLALILAVLVTLKIQTISSIVILAFLTGIVVAFSFPAWQAIISEIVPRKDLLNAIALNSAQFNAARLLGPTLAGFVIAGFGVAACFYLNSVSFLAVIAALALIRVYHHKRPAVRSGWEEFLEGIQYAWKNKIVLYLLLGVGVLSVFGLASYTVLMPIFARNILKGGPKTYGFLLGANGFGALVGALITAYISYFIRRSKIIKFGLLFFSLSMIVFAFSGNIYLSMGAMVFTGFSFMAVSSTLNTSLQSMVPQRIRGRIMSLFVWMFLGQMPLGSLLAGSVAHLIGAPKAVGLSAVVPLSLSIYLFISFPQFERPKAEEEQLTKKLF